MVQTKCGSSEVILPGSSGSAKHFKRMPLGRCSSDSEDSHVTFLGGVLAPSQQDNPTIWVTKGNLAEVTRKARKSFGEAWKVKALPDAPSPGFLATKDSISNWVQPTIGPNDSLESTIRCVFFKSFHYLLQNSCNLF